MTNIYLTAYGDFNDQKLLKLICNYFTKNINKNELQFISALGGKNGDIICRNYIIHNDIKHKFLKPSQMDKSNTLEQCDHAILFNNGKSKGIGISLKLLPYHIKGKIIEVHTNLNQLSVYQLDKDIITKHYSINGNRLEIS